MIYGDPEAFPEYAARLRRIAANDPRIRFCGAFPNEKISDIFSTLDVLVVPSIWYENTPLVIYSAQACRCPVIASNLGVCGGGVHEENGLLFEPGNPADLARAAPARGDRALRELGSGQDNRSRSRHTFNQNVYESS
jgi:glycosyltransferase involved in cell wall biosynthesis